MSGSHLVVIVGGLAMVGAVLVTLVLWTPPMAGPLPPPVTPPHTFTPTTIPEVTPTMPYVRENP